MLGVTPVGGRNGGPDVGVRLPGGPAIGGPDTGGPEGGPSDGGLAPITPGGIKPGGRTAVPTVGGAPGGPRGLGDSWPDIFRVPGVVAPGSMGRNPAGPLRLGGTAMGGAVPPGVDGGGPSGEGMIGGRGGRPRESMPFILPLKK
jgi:hypothetical protein